MHFTHQISRKLEIAEGEVGISRKISNLIGWGAINWNQVMAIT